MSTPAPPVTLQVDFVSDISCPWCAVGLHSLEQAIDRVRDGIRVDVRLQPFELNPQMGALGQDIAEHLMQKYGSTPAQLEQNREVIRQRGADVGFTFNARDRVYNTFDAQRLLHWAGIEHGNRQLALKHALLRAYFTDGEDVSSHAVLTRVAGSVGLDAQRAQAVLASNEYAAEVRSQQRYYTSHGIHSVPAVIINERHLISGGQPVEVFEQALRNIAAGEAR